MHFISPKISFSDNSSPLFFDLITIIIIRYKIIKHIDMKATNINNFFFKEEDCFNLLLLIVSSSFIINSLLSFSSFILNIIIN